MNPFTNPDGPWYPNEWAAEYGLAQPPPQKKPKVAKPGKLPAGAQAAANPFYFGPNVTNPTGEVPQAGQPASPEQAQLQQLQGLFTKLQDPAARLQLASMLGQANPAPSDDDFMQFLGGLTDANNA